MNLQELKLTPKRIETCERLGLFSSDDILSYYPYRYEEYVLSDYDTWNIGDTVTFKAEVISYPSTFRYGKRSTTKFKVFNNDIELIITIFNRPWLDIDINDEIVIIGKYNGKSSVTALNYYKKSLDEVLGIWPIYSLKDGINQSYLKKIIELTYDRCKDELIDLVPSKYIASHHLISYKDAIFNIHFPKDKMMLAKSLSRLKYEEFLRFYISLDIINGNSNRPIKRPKSFELDKIKDFIAAFNFELTEGQKTASKEILDDLSSNKIMYRLLQGDVGCGKTAVCMIALYANYLSGYTGVLMAPTEILAKQHYKDLCNIFNKFNVKVGLLYSGIEDSNKIKEMIKNKEIDIVVGTHALFSDDVDFKDLGLVITDEQHRFGVNQRRKLKEKGDKVDFLMMSATPIPRTLASSIYGDMDISTIESLPNGRKGCKTYLIKKNSIVDIMPNIKETLKDNRQIYIIAASINENENYNAKDVINLYNSLKEELKPYNVAFLHGKLNNQDKDLIMEDFNLNKIQVLISTTVVEVGVNVKNATMMIIYDADKFGLSQLHQLRGRVQRGNLEGSCYLLTNTKDENALNRLEVLCNSNDGFKIALEDLKIRGPGDILGTRQSGLPSFILGNIIEDTKFIEASKKDAKEIMANLDDPDNNKYYLEIVSKISHNHFD